MDILQFLTTLVDQRFKKFIVTHTFKVLEYWMVLMENIEKIPKYLKSYWNTEILPFCTFWKVIKYRCVFLGMKQIIFCIFYMLERCLIIDYIIDWNFFVWLSKKNSYVVSNKSYIWKPQHLMCFCILIIVDNLFVVSVSRKWHFTINWI